jgi:hypothetical protein
MLVSVIWYCDSMSEALNNTTAIPTSTGASLSRFQSVGNGGVCSDYSCWVSFSLAEKIN